MTVARPASISATARRPAPRGQTASTDITYWPHAIRAGVELKNQLPRARDHYGRGRHGNGRGLLRHRRRREIPAGRGRHPGLQRHRHATAAVELRIRAVSEWARQFQRPRGQESDVPPLGDGPWLCRRTNGRASRPAALEPVEPGVFTRPTAPARLLAGLQFPVQPHHWDRHRGSHRRSERAGALGARAITIPSGLAGHRVSVGICTEDLPEEHNRVTLDPVLKDGNGIPAPRIDYTIGENTNCMLDFAIDRGKEDSRRGRCAACQRRPPSRPWRLAPARHCPYGQRSGTLGGERLGPLP